MKTALALSSVLVVAASSALSGCASIVSGRHADVAIDTYPTNAHVEIHDNNGHTVASLETPGMVSLKRNRRWFLPARYTAVIDAPGYEPTFVPIHSTINPWILGNVVIGGIPGLIVDNATGAAWRPSESEIHRQLYPVVGASQEPMVSANGSASRGSKKDPQYVADRARPATTSASDHPNAVRPASTF